MELQTAFKWFISKKNFVNMFCIIIKVLFMIMRRLKVFEKIMDLLKVIIINIFL